MIKILKRCALSVFAILRPAGHFFSKDELAKIEQAIEMAERCFSGEICFAAEGRLTIPEIFRGLDVVQRAEEVFSQMRVWDTEQNNGVLLYLQLSERKLAIIADRSVKRVIEQAQFDSLCRSLEEACAGERYTEGVISVIETIADLLSPHFRPEDGSSAVNELSNKPKLL
jgi:uncharacterized membrane protein